MISNKLKTIIFLSAPFFVLHQTEEYLTKFYQIDDLSRFAFQLFEPMGSLQATFLLFEIMTIVLFIVSYLFLKGGKAILALAILFGSVFIFELHHLVKAIQTGGYYPGIVTAIFIYILGFFYWKELLINWRKNYGK